MSTPVPAPPASGPASGIDRREFCLCALAVAAATACGGGGGGSSAPAPAPAPAPTPITTTETKANLLALPSGTVRDYTTTTAGSCPLVSGAAQGYYLVRDAGGIYAFSASCLHLGGHINPNGSGGFNCPCHGSQYDLNGTVTVGPAPVGAVLQHVQVRESTAGGVLLIDPSQPVAATTRLT